MTQTGSDPFSSADLETNKAGRLSDGQRKVYSSMEHGIRKEWLGGAAVCAAIAALLITATGPAPNAQYRPLAGAAFGFAAVACLYLATFWVDSLTRDLRSGRVAVVEGAIYKRSVSTNSGTSSSTRHYFDVAGKSYPVGYTAFEAAPDAGYVRLYVLPASRRVINFERLPDPPLPAGFTASPAAALSTLGTALFSHDRVKAAEARAEFASVKDAMRIDRSANATPPPPGQQDPRPLAQAILGAWKTGLMSIQFMPDGTLVATLPTGGRRQGRWSVGADGRLHSDAMGRDQAAQAWVANDTLTISDGSDAISYRRIEAS
jgi:hypothetical protein